MYRKLISPLFIQWEVTPECNYKCIHCYNYWRKEEQQPSVDIDYCEITKEIIKSKPLHVTITGGEPLSRLAQLIPYIRELVRNDIYVSINTNASLASKEISNELKDSGVSSVLVSFISGNEDNFNLIAKNQNSYGLTLQGIKNLCDAGLNVSANMVVTKLNIQDIYNTGKLLKDLPIKLFSATKASTPCAYDDFIPYRIDRNQLDYMFNELLRVKEDFDLEVGTSEFYPYCLFRNNKQFKQFGNHLCSAGKTEIAIGYDGLIRACPHSKKSYGHYSDGIARAWDRMDGWRADDNIPVNCIGCKYAYKCSGGCKEEAFNAFGDYAEPDPFAQFDYRVNFDNRAPNVMIQDDYEYSISKSLKARKETSGFLIYVTPSKWLLVSDKFAELLFSHTTVSVNKIHEFYRYDEAKKTIEYLLNKNLIFERINNNE